MAEYDFESSMGYWISMTSHQYQQRLNEHLTPYGITFRQFQVLGWLVHDGNLTHAQIADRLMIEPPTLTGILDRMEREGWIARQPAKADRRVRLISLRPEAEELWNNVVDCLDRLRHHATRGMSAQEIELLRALLSKVRANLESVPSVSMGEPATIR